MIDFTRWKLRQLRKNERNISRFPFFRFEIHRIPSIRENTRWKFSTTTGKGSKQHYIQNGETNGSDKNDIQEEKRREGKVGSEARAISVGKR